MCKTEAYERLACVTYEIENKAVCTLGTADQYPYPSKELGATIGSALTRLGSPGADFTLATAILEFDALEGEVDIEDARRDELWKDLIEVAESIDVHCRYLNQVRDALLHKDEENTAELEHFAALEREADAIPDEAEHLKLRPMTRQWNKAIDAILGEAEDMEEEQANLQSGRVDLHMPKA